MRYAPIEQDLFDKDELVAYAKEWPERHVVVRAGHRFTFQIVDDDMSVVDHVNGVDCYGELAWPVRNRYTGRDERPAHFTGAARKLSGHLCDTIWWEPYREGRNVYDSPAEVRFMSDLLDYGFIGCVVTVEEGCQCCGAWSEIAHESLWGIESPLVADGNYDYLGEVFDDLLVQAAHDIRRQL